MIKEIKFKKARLLFGTFFCLIMLSILITFLLKPNIFIRNVFMKSEHIQIIGIIGSIYFLTLIFSILKLFPREYAIQITKEFLIDNSKYESLGKIEWGNVSKIKKVKRKSIELFVNKSVLQSRKTNLVKKILVFMNNWNYKKSIIISSALMNCSLEELYDEINLAHQNHKKSANKSHISNTPTL